MRRKTESMFAEFAAKLSNKHMAASSSDISSSPSDSSDLDLLEDFDINRWRFGGRAVSKETELERYLKSLLMILEGKKANIEFDCLANQAEYPILSRIALELYAIPGMSAEVERIFSGYFFCFISN